MYVVDAVFKINIQQNSFNPSSDNLALKEESSSNTFYHKKASSMKQIDPRNKFKKATKSFCISTVVVSPDPSSQTLSTYSATKTKENIEEYPDDPEPAAKGDIQMEYSPD
jgi:hypothetical protein